MSVRAQVGLYKVPFGDPRNQGELIRTCCERGSIDHIPVPRISKHCRHVKQSIELEYGASTVDSGSDCMN